MKVIIALLIATSTLAQVPYVKDWPDNWSASFTENLYFPIKGKSTTTGKWWYSNTQQSFRVDREDGRYDRYCGFEGMLSRKKVPCTQIVKNGVRYLHFPTKKNLCCRCCSAKHGCGIVNKTWMKGATFKGTKTDSDGQMIYMFNKQGGEPNMIEQTADGKMRRLNQVPLSDMSWNPSTYSEAEINSSVFDLPTDNCNKFCPMLSVCTLVRKVINV